MLLKVVLLFVHKLDWWNLQISFRMGLIKNNENQDHFWSFDKCNLTHFQTGPIKEIFQINLIKEDDKEKRQELIIKIWNH